MLDHPTHVDVSAFSTSTLVRRLLKRKFYVIAAGLAGFAFAVIYLHLVTPTYTAELKVTPAASSTQLGSKFDRLGGLGALASVGLGGASGPTPFDLYLEAITSRAVATMLVQDPKIMHGIFEGEWNTPRSEWRQPYSFASSVSQGVRSVLGLRVYPWRAPDNARLQQYIRDRVVILKSGREPVTRLMFSHKDPILAAYLLEKINKSADYLVRMNNLRQATEYSSYLAQKVRTTAVAEQRAALTDALSDQEKMIMMASSRVPYAANLLEEPTVSPFPTQPKVLFILLLLPTLATFAAACLCAIEWERII